MAVPLKPKIEKRGHGPDKTHNQPPARVVENPPAKTVAQALANSKRQVDATK